MSTAAWLFTNAEPPYAAMRCGYLSDRIDNAVLTTLAGDVLRPPVVMAIIDGVTGDAVVAVIPSDHALDVPGVPWNRAFYETRGFQVVDARHLPPEHLAPIASGGRVAFERTFE